MKFSNFSQSFKLNIRKINIICCYIVAEFCKHDKEDAFNNLGNNDNDDIGNNDNDDIGNHKIQSGTSIKIDSSRANSFCYCIC